MTRKEQVKILDDKIKANKRQYDLDRTNAEISADPSGDLPKYEYLTKKDLEYKPDAFEQAKFEYSPLGKVFIDGLDKFDRKEGLLKRLKNIEDKSNNQLLAIKDIYRPAIKGKDNGGYKSSDNDDDDKLYKKIKGTREEYEKEGNFSPYAKKEFNNIVKKSLNLEGKKYIYGKKRSIYIDTFKNNYKNIVDDFASGGKTIDDIKNQLNEVNKGIEIYEKNEESYKKSPNI